MKNINIVNFYASDLNGISEGGIASYVREILKQSSGRMAYSLVGVTGDIKYKIGDWSSSAFGGTKFNFFPVLYTRGEHITYKGGMPLNARYLFKLFRYRSKILEVADSLHFHRVELALPFILFCKNKKPIIITIHGNNYDIRIAQKHALFRKKWFRYVFHKLASFVIKRADKIIFVSLDAFESYSNIYKNIKGKFSFLSTFVDMDLFKPMDKDKCLQENKLSIDKKILLFVGRLDEQKGLDLLLDGYKLCQKQSNNGFLLLIAGDGIERRPLEDRVNNEDIKGIVFLGSLLHSFLSKIINCADVFVLTSLWEGMPIVILEALACGIPVVATNVGQIGAVVKDGVNGFIIYNRDPEFVKECIFKALSLKNGIKKICRDSVLSFSSPTIVSRIEDIHRTLLNE
ncbi:MAG: glycosyltransferase family 4 protein [Candidatus Omnitrophica bacterium]|nr:glycosyltransferase family 4 protein [Candidatus Omnitrophota bacterium]